MKVYKPQSAIFRLARHLVLLCRVRSSSMLCVITVSSRLVSHTLTDCEPTRWIFCDLMNTLNQMSYSDWLRHTFIKKIINPIDAYACFHKQLQDFITSSPFLFVHILVKSFKVLIVDSVWSIFIELRSFITELVHHQEAYLGVC